MKPTRTLIALAVTFTLSLVSFLSLPLNTVTARDPNVALQRGYRTGYSDGYMAGYRDSIDKSAKDYTRHSEYTDANRAYNKDYGSVEDYRDGYRQGFEAGYETGFEKRSFESAIPSNLNLRGNSGPITPIQVTQATAIPAATSTNTPVETPTSPPAQSESTSPTAQPAIIQKASYTNQDDPVIIIPKDTELILELESDISTEKNRAGDKFTAKVVSPQEINGAIIEGRIDKITKPGRIKRRSQMQLSFDRIIISEHRWSNFDAIMTEVLPVKGDNVKTVDNEGTAVGKSSLKGDIIKVGAPTGAGAGIGAIAGGPVGAAVGAGVGAAFGVGAVIIERGKHIRLNENQQLKVKTSYETQIR
jgi:hypothetical protein